MAAGSILDAADDRNAKIGFNLKRPKSDLKCIKELFQGSSSSSSSTRIFSTISIFILNRSRQNERTKENKNNHIRSIATFQKRQNAKQLFHSILILDGKNPPEKIPLLLLPRPPRLPVVASPISKTSG